MFTREDPWVNVLRSTLAAFGASVGGADSITVLPYDTVLGLPERLGRRLARNTQILLADESNVGRVTDPGGGSWYLESLTDQVADAVWARFQEVERAGGAVQALADGLLHRLGHRGDRRRARPRDLHPSAPDHRGVDVPRVRARRRLERRSRRAVPARDRALAPRRDSTVFEELRDRAQALVDPSVIVRTLGTAPRLRRQAGLRDQPARRRRHPGQPRTAPGSRCSRRAQRRMPVRAPPRSPTCAPPSSGCSSRGGPASWATAADQVDGEVHDGMDVVGVPLRPARPPGRPCRPRHDRRTGAHRPHHAGGSAMSAVPDFTTLDLGAGRPDGAPVPDGEPWLTPEQIPVKPLYTEADLAGLDFLDTVPGAAALPARPVPDDVRHPAVDHPPVRRLLHGRGVQRVLPAQPRRRAEGPVDRLRPGHPPRLRLRPPAGDRRRRHGRRGHRLDPRHAHPVRRHPARPDERVDDDERRRAARAGALRRRGRGAGRGARAAHRDHPERHPQGVHGPQHLHLPARALDADHRRHLRLHQRRRCRSSTPSRSPATTCRRPGRRRTSSSPTRWPTAWSTSAPASPRASTSTRSRRGCRSSGPSA